MLLLSSYWDNILSSKKNFFLKKKAKKRKKKETIKRIKKNLCISCKLIGFPRGLANEKIIESRLISLITWFVELIELISGARECNKTKTN